MDTSKDALNKYYYKGDKCSECGKPITTGSKSGKCQRHAAIREQRYNWKGNKASYQSIHDWMRLHFGSADHCDNDRTHIASRYHWANISHEYKRERSDWKQLCVRCHAKFDHYSGRPRTRHLEGLEKENGEWQIEQEYIEQGVIDEQKKED